jgi:type I restriction enzyme S subunit
MSQTIYKEWFVNFRFPGHEKVKYVDSPLGKIPEGWEIEKFPKYVYFQEGPGLRTWQWTSEGMKVINVKNIQWSGEIIVDNTDKHISLEEFEKMYKHFEINNGDFVVASSGNTYGKIGRILKTHLPLILNTSVIRFRTKDENHLPNSYLWYYLNSEYFRNQIESFIIGSAQPNFGPTHIKMMNLLIPKKDILDLCVPFFSNAIQVVDKLRLKNENLRKTRDLLLPKLMSGEVKI